MEKLKKNLLLKLNIQIEKFKLLKNNLNKEDYIEYEKSLKLLELLKFNIENIKLNKKNLKEYSEISIEIDFILQKSTFQLF